MRAHPRRSDTGPAILENCDAALLDAREIISKRLAVGLGLALLTLLFAALMATYAPKIDASWLATPGTIAIGVLYYGDTMRLVFLPVYRLTLPNVIRLLAVLLIELSLLVIFWTSFYVAIARLPLSPNMLHLLRQAAGHILIVYFSTKLVFAGFALL
jgi:hypothetical protein